ncbi:MAG: hypothetical protein ACI9DC_004215 [Gammaproteobacteria bacterium]|jgi:hypothetical protein
MKTPTGMKHLPAKTTVCNTFRRCLFVAAVGLAPAAHGVPLTVLNHSFEDVSAQSQVNEFYFGVNTDWQVYNAAAQANADIFFGTLNPDYAGAPMPTDSGWFTDPTPDGSQVALLFGFGSGRGQPGPDSSTVGEYGIQQTLSGVLEANTHYVLQVEVGNIAQGTASSGGVFPLDGFPGYRIDLMIDDVILASDNNSLTIDEGRFATSTLTFDVGDSHALLGEALKIRLVNLNTNVDENGDPAPVGNDIEVDFDFVRLDATEVPRVQVPEPFTAGLLALGLIGLGLRQRRA